MVLLLEAIMHTWAFVNYDFRGSELSCLDY